MKRILIILALLVCSSLVLGSLAACATSSDQTIVVYNWEDYIDPDVVDEFTQETGIKVTYARFSTVEEMYMKISSGSVAYDVAFPSDYMIERMIAEGNLQKIDFNNVPEFKNINPDFHKLEYDPAGEYSVPYMWGTVGILYNTTKVDGDVDSWGALWDPANTNEVLMIDSMRDAIGITLKLLGYSMNDRSDEALAKAQQKLIEQRPIVRAYVVDDAKDQMKRGAASLAVVWSGDALTSIEENEDLEYVVPKEGTNLWFDCMVIPKGAKNKAGAEAFINFMCRPDIAARNAEYIGYSTPNSAALELLDEELVEDPIFNPPQEVLDRSEIFRDLGSEFLAKYNAIWEAVRMN